MCVYMYTYIYIYKHIMYILINIIFPPQAPARQHPAQAKRVPSPFVYYYDY